MSQDYPKPSLTADIVCLSYDFKAKKHKILLIQRGKDPFKGSWALPGGFVNEGERSIEAAARELKEETGLDVPVNQFKQIGLYDTPNRDPRGWVISAAYYLLSVNDLGVAKAGDDAANISVFDIDNLPTLAFDHATIIADAVHNIIYDGKWTGPIPEKFHG